MSLLKLPPEVLFQRAIERLEALDFEKAEKIANTLIRRRNTGGYEIKARVLAEEGNEEAAVEVLKEGLEHGPGVTVLWYWLGTYLSNLGRFEEALTAFYRYRETGADEAFALFNLALVRSRMGDPDTALAFLNDALALRPKEPRFESAKVWCHIQLLEFSKAILLAESIDQHEVDSRLVAYRARAWLELGETAKAVELAWQAIELDKSIVVALEVVRTQNPLATDRTRACRVVVEGEISNEHQTKLPKGCRKFFAIYWAYCDSVEEALEFVRSFEPDASQVKINEIEWLEDKIQGRKGVVRAMDRYFTYPA